MRWIIIHDQTVKIVNLKTAFKDAFDAVHRDGRQFLKESIYVTINTRRDS